MDLEKIIPTNFIEEEILNDLKSGRSKEVVTRCPPEPTGYWHIGHCKAWFVDFETAIKFGGYTNLRMDDTNPTREDGEFADSYLDDLKWLGYTPKNFIYASEAYFEETYKIAEKMIKNGDAYVCSLSQEEVQYQRGTLTQPGVNSPYRERSIDENLKLFHEMREGKFKDGEITLRAKISMSHPNILMRDPIMYRVMHKEHYKVGNKWCIYPMYDFAHPLQDCLEGVTYSLCDTTFRVHRELYDWFVEHGWGKKYAPKQREFGMLSIENVLLGKRFLKILVNSKKVMGWDDPRLMTIIGMRRRGYTSRGVKNFIASTGVTTNACIIPFSTLEYHIREDLNLITNRAMVVLKPLKVKITNYDEIEDVIIPNNPNNETSGNHVTKFSNTIFIEQDDFSLNPPPKYNRLVIGGMVRLKGAYIIKCNNVKYKKDGSIDFLECEYIQNSKSGNDNSNIKVKGTIHFVCEKDMFKIKIREFKNLTKMEFLWPTKELLDGRPLEDVIEKDSMIEYEALAESYLKSAKIEEKYQFIRNGYFCMDKDSSDDFLVFNKTIGLKDSYKPNLQNK